MNEKSSDRQQRDEAFRRRLEWEQRLRKSGGLAEPIGYGLMLIGLAIAVFGRYLPGGNGGILVWLGLGFLFPALACFLIVLLNRRRWRRDHPFKG